MRFFRRWRSGFMQERDRIGKRQLERLAIHRTTVV
jgi:hypothetical protein